jgi:hypothetical protein
MIQNPPDAYPRVASYLEPEWQLREPTLQATK